MNKNQVSLRFFFFFNTSLQELEGKKRKSFKIWKVNIYIDLPTHPPSLKKNES